MTLLSILFNRCFKVVLPFMVMVCFSGFAQQDTLKNLIQANGPEKLTQLEYWCNKKLFFRKPSDRVESLRKLEQIALKKNDKIILASIVFYRGLYVMAMDRQQHKRGVALMQKAIAMADKNGQQLQVAYFKHSLGYYYFTTVKNPVEALQNMLQAHYIFEETGYENLYNPAGMLDRLGYVYYHLSNFHEAIKYFKLSLKNPMESERRQIGILNSVGLSYRELFEPDSARKYFKQSRHQAIVAKDTAWIGINSGDIGRYYLSEKSYALAKPFIQEYYRCGLAVKDTELVVEALTGLGDISLNSGNVDQAFGQLKQAETLLEQEFRSGDMPLQNYLRKQYLFSVLAKVWDVRGNSPRALYYLKESNKIKDSIERRARLSKNTSIQQMFEAEKTNNRLQLLNEEKEAAEVKLKLYIAIVLSLAIIIALLYSRQIRERKIQKQKEVLLNLEKEIVETELKSSREQLEEYVRNLRQKAELLDRTQSEMDLIRQQQQIPAEDEQTILQKLNFATILTEDDWTRFKVLFEKVHTGFFLKLKTAYPGLTPAETRLCSLIKLDFNSHQMAAMMGISAMSVKKNRQRLRKKIDLSKDQKLEDLFVDF
ncbi:hypothetical protein ACX0HA_15930 [Flavobacterium hauense]